MLFGWRLSSFWPILTILYLWYVRPLKLYSTVANIKTYPKINPILLDVPFVIFCLLAVSQRYGLTSFQFSEVKHYLIVPKLVQSKAKLQSECGWIRFKPLLYVLCCTGVFIRKKWLLPHSILSPYTTFVRSRITDPFTQVLKTTSTKLYVSNHSQPLLTKTHIWLMEKGFIVIYICDFWGTL